MAAVTNDSASLVEENKEPNKDKEKDSAVALVESIQKKIGEAFDIFDHESSKQVDVREIGTIIRSLGCCPTEAELQDILTEIEEEDNAGYIRFEKFLPVATRILMERRYKPAPEDQLLKAFRVLDAEGKGFLTSEDLTRLMTTEGEPFTEEEMDEFRSAALDHEKNIFVYKDFVPSLTVEEAMS